MNKQRSIMVRIDETLYRQVKDKCKTQLGIGMAPLVKIMLKAFATQKGVGFYIGDEDLCGLFSRWLHKKSMEKKRKGCARLPGPLLRDLYELSPKDKRRFDS